jgi:hypothetical protein
MGEMADWCIMNEFEAQYFGNYYEDKYYEDEYYHDEPIIRISKNEAAVNIFNNYRDLDLFGADSDKLE